jgi:biopolymer transport protein ExbD
MARGEVRAALVAALARTPNLVLALDVDPEAEYTSAMRAMALARNAGVEAIGVIND